MVFYGIDIPDRVTRWKGRMLTGYPAQASRKNCQKLFPTPADVLYVWPPINL